MTKKRLLLIASLPLTIAAPLAALAMLPPRPGVTKANFDRIEEGMTWAEVEAIMGGKAEPRYPPWWFVANQYGKIAWTHWKAKDGSVAAVVFGDDGVVFKRWSYEFDEPIFDKIRRWLAAKSATQS